ncbi:MAG: FmdB family transcriptional regulator, partial [Gemmatimonadetes bacterium]|nr:FmdB family transcriptional regulator [Gemmatimonadota bacterium]
MPTYEYACKKCGERLEVMQSFSDKPLKKHKTCGGDLQKVFHPAGLIFKGSGFYVTDSRSSSRSSSSRSTTSRSSSSSAGKSDSSKSGSSSGSSSSSSS